MQLVELRDFAKQSGWQICREYMDEAYTGGNTKRPAFLEMLADANKRKFDILLVWKLDRLGRSLRDLITILDEVVSFGIDFISCDNQLNTSTPTGKLTFQIIGAVAEFEKDITRERVIAGLANARRKGKILGRPPIPPTLYEKAKILRQKGLSFRKIGHKLGVDEATIRKKMKNDT